MKAVLGTLFLVFACTQAATTMRPHHSHPPHQHHSHAPHGSHPTNEPVEKEGFNFAYEPHSHQMIMNNPGEKSCYIIDLTDAERMAVHTDSGMRALELKLLNMLDTATKTEMTRDMVEQHLARFCNKHAMHIYKIN